MNTQVGIWNVSVRELAYGYVMGRGSSAPIKEKDNETQYSYFGARYYDSDLSIFLSIDRFADKYPNLSPYQYCAWNPIRITDPTGDTLRIASGQSAEFTKAVNDAFDKLKSTKSGKEMYDNLQNSSQVFEIRQNTSSDDKPNFFRPNDLDVTNAETGETTTSNKGGTIVWDMVGGKIPVQKEAGFVRGVLQNGGMFSLFHEMAHAEDQSMGKFKGFASNWNKTGLMECEWSATHRENQIRAEMSAPLRTHYNTTRSGSMAPGLLKWTPSGIESKYVKGYMYTKFLK